MPIPHFILSWLYSPFSNALVIQGMMNVVHRECVGPMDAVHRECVGTMNDVHRACVGPVASPGIDGHRQLERGPIGYVVESGRLGYP